MRAGKRLNYIVLACFVIITLSSYVGGPALVAGYDCTGAETGLGNPLGCSNNTCHHLTATPGIAVAIELDSAGMPVTEYDGGMSYTIKLTGTNNTFIHLPKFGFQVGAIVGAAAQVTPFNAGTFQSLYPTNTHYSAPNPGNYVVGVVEHSTQLSPASGSGNNGTIYSETIHWKAPAPGTGTISIWAAINAVDDNGINDTGDHWNTNQLVVAESAISSVNSVRAESDNVNIFPNPFSLTARFNFSKPMNNASLSLYDLSGMEVQRAIIFSGNKVSLDRGKLAAGIYVYRIINDDGESLTGKLLVQ